MGLAVNLWEAESSHTNRNPKAPEARHGSYRDPAFHATGRFRKNELGCLLMLFKMSGCKSVKHWHFLQRAELKRWFPRLCSYSSLIRWFGQLDDFMEGFARSKLVANETNATYAVDSTKINPHHLKNNGKTLGSLASIGFSHDCKWWGFTLHVVCDLQWRVANFEMTPGKTHDLKPVERGLLDGLRGLCWADSGYVKQNPAQELRSKGLVFRAKPTKAVDVEHERFMHYHAKAYRQRQVVEGVFSQLKGTFGLIQHTARSERSVCAHVFAALAARACAQTELAEAKNRA